MKTRTHIANLIITEPTKFRIDSSYAAWFDEIEVQPGVFPLYGNIEHGRVPLGHPHDRIGCVLTGPVVASDWGARLSGVPVSGRGINENLGETKQYHWSIAGYALAHALLEGKSANVELLPGFQPQWKEFISCVTKEVCRTANIVTTEQDPTLLAAIEEAKAQVATDRQKRVIVGEPGQYEVLVSAEIPSWKWRTPARVVKEDGAVL